MKPNNKKTKVTPKAKKILTPAAPVAKSLHAMIKDEDGYVSKETILKVGLSTVAALGVVGAMTDISADGGNFAVHNNAFSVGALDNCISHTNVTTHTSY